MELGLFQPSWEKQVSKTETISANEPCWGFWQTPQNLGFFRKNRKLLKIDRNGLSNWTLCSKLQQFRFKVCQAERNGCDSTGNPWAIVFSFRTESICASRQRSYVPRPPPHNGRLFLDFGAIFSQVTLNCLVNMIHQEIWPSPGTISTHHSRPFRARTQWKGEGACRSRWPLGSDCLPALLLPLHPAKFVGRAFLHSAGGYFHPQICVCATFSLVANATAAACS